MFDLDRWQEIFSTFKKNKLRFFLTAFGVSWGIFMFVMLSGASEGLKNGVTKRFGGFATNSVYVWPQSTSLPYRGMRPGRRFPLRNSDGEALKREVGEIEILAPRNQLGGYGDGNNVSRGFNSGNFQVMGDYPQFNLIQPKNITDGRFVNDRDIEERRKVAVIGSRVSEVLFDSKEVPVGEYIKIQGIYFQVVGEFGASNSTFAQDRDLETIYIPFTTFQNAFNYGDKVSWFAMNLKPDASGNEVEVKVKNVLKARHQVAPADDRALGSYNAEEAYRKMTGIFMVIEFIVLLVGGGTLLAGVIGVTNIMLIVVKERTKEIGIRRALGAQPFSIVYQILMESVVITFFSGLIGMTVGIFCIELLGKFVEAEAFSDPNVSFNTALSSVFVLTVAGLFAGLLPSQRAISIAPVDALRTE